MKKQEIRHFLEKNCIPYEWIDHKAVYNMQELAEIELPHPEAEAKNLFVRDDKKRNYYLITVKGDKHVDLKDFQKKNGTRRLSFASDDDLYSILELTPGAVSPLGILNDRECKVIFYLDDAFLGGAKLIGIHPNDNTATVWLAPADLIDIIKKHGNAVNLFKMSGD